MSAAAVIENALPGIGKPLPTTAKGRERKGERKPLERKRGSERRGRLRRTLALSAKFAQLSRIDTQGLAVNRP